MHVLFLKSWLIPEATPEVCLEHVTSAVAILSEKEKMHINKVGSCTVHDDGTHGGLMVTVLISRSVGSSPDQGHCVVFLGKTLYFHSTDLSTQEYKWVPANLMLGVTLR